MNTDAYDIIILIPHYNNTLGLTKTLNSIHNERHTMKVMTLIVDDYSSFPFQHELDIVDTISTVEVIKSRFDKGVSHALNYGLSYINRYYKVTFIARIDCGDLITNNRLAKQFQFMANQPDISLVGSWVQYFWKGENQFVLRPPLKHSSIIKNIYFHASFIHPSVMLRFDTLKSVGYYPTNYDCLEDYALFFEILKVSKTANMDEVLTLVENNPDGISSRKRMKQQWSKLRLLCHNRQWSFSFILGIMKILIVTIIPKQFLNFLKKKFFR